MPKLLNKLIFVVAAVLLTGYWVSPVHAAGQGLDLTVDLEMGAGRDSNVAIDDIDLSLSDGDNYTDAGFSTDLRYRLDDHWDLSAGVTVSDKRYHTYDSFDGQLVIASAGADRQWGDVTAGISLRWIDYELDESPFLTMEQVSPTLSWFPSRNLFVRFDYVVSDEEFDASPGRNSHREGAGGTAYYFLNGLRHYWLFRAGFSTDDADDPVFSYRGREGRFLYHRALPALGQDTSIEIIYRFEDRQYEKVREPDLDEFRRDRRSRLELRLNYPVGESLELSARYARANYRSNLESAAFRQHVYQLKLTYEIPLIQGGP